jgi:uncharacterized Ntn-hydrolase superfamily protein
MKLKCLFCAIGFFVAAFFQSLAFATIYIAAYDPNTKSIGLAYSSSGANFWQTLVKGKGLVGAQASGLCREATPLEFLNQGLTASHVVRSIYDQCHAVGWEAYRVISVTTDGAIDWVFGANGCHAGNAYCGGVKDKNIAVTGGGLSKDVLEKTLAAYQAIDPLLPLQCRLLKTLEAMYQAGGEIKEFKGASVTVDTPIQDKLLHWESRGSEATLLAGLKMDCL